MANVDLVDLIPILKAINSIKNQYKDAIETAETDFSLYPVLTQNFLDKSYNNGYVVGFRQCLTDYLGTSDGIEIDSPRSMREVVPATYESQSEDATYDTLTSIMNFCLQIRRNLKEILDLDTDLFEEYPPQVLTLAQSQYVAGYNDGYLGAISYVEGLEVLPPTINSGNNIVTLTSPQESVPTLEMFYKKGSLDGEWIQYYKGDVIQILESESPVRIYAYARIGSKNSSIASRVVDYNDFMMPTIEFENNVITIYPNYGSDSPVKTKYKLSSWTGYNDFLDYDGLPIPITSQVTVWAYNYLGEQQSETASRICTPSESVLTRPATPTITFSSQNNVLTVSTTTPGCTLYYQKVGSGDGWVPYYGPVILAESGTYTAIAVKDGVESLPSENVVCSVSTSGGGVTPSQPVCVAPTVVCNNNKISVITSQSGVKLYLSNQGRTNYGSPDYDPANEMTPGKWYEYTGQVPISESGKYQAKAVLIADQSKYAYSVVTDCTYFAATPGSGSNSGGGSGASTDEYVAPPLLNYSNSILSITPITIGSTAYYREKGTDTWTLYSEPISVTDTITYETKAVKNTYESSISEIECISEIPAIPSATITDFTVTMTTDTPAATIKYREQGDSIWLDYEQPFNIYEDKTFEMKSMKNGYESETVTQTLHPCVYPCVITFYSNIVSITCRTSGAVIKYKKSTDSEWSTYSSPFSISSSATYQAKAIYNGLESQETSLYCEYYANYSNEFFTVEALEDNTVVYLTWVPNALFDTEPNGYYSINNGPWTRVSWGYSEYLPILNTGDTIRFKAQETYPSNGGNAVARVDKVVVGRSIGEGEWENAQFNVYGNIMSLFNGDSFNADTPCPTNGIKEIFMNSKVVSAENLVLPYNSLQLGAFYGMFYNCTELTSVPVLAATVLAEGCYQYMFYGCTGLTTLPEYLLPATTLAEGCYEGMFYGCTGLTTLPEYLLPAPTLPERCYSNMFQYCTSLTSAPALIAHNLTDYRCYGQMFYGCSSLSYIRCSAINIGYLTTVGWLNGVAANGTFVKRSGVEWPSGASGIPDGWSVVEV